MINDDDGDGDAGEGGHAGHQGGVGVGVWGVVARLQLMCW